MNKNEIKVRLKAIDKEINALQKERHDLNKLLNEINQREDDKIHLQVVKDRYIYAKKRVGQKVYSVYVGTTTQFKGLKDKRLKEISISKMRNKLKE